MADGIVFAVVVVFEEIGLIAVDDAVGCCANALSCEFIDSVGDCTGAANAGVGIVKGKLRMKFLSKKIFVIFWLFFFSLAFVFPPSLSVCLYSCVLVFQKLSFFNTIVFFLLLFVFLFQLKKNSTHLKGKKRQGKNPQL